MKAIICFDDDRLVTTLLTYQLKTLLSENEFLVEICNDPRAGSEMVKQLTNMGIEVPLVITDYQMPHLNGIELSKRIRQSSPKTKFIMLSGQVNQTILKDSLEKKELTSFIEKPWSIEELKSEIERTLKF